MNILRYQSNDADLRQGKHPMSFSKRFESSLGKSISTETRGGISRTEVSKQIGLLLHNHNMLFMYIYICIKRQLQELMFTYR